MRRGNGFVRVFSGMMLALILLLGVCAGVGAAVKADKVSPEQIDEIERKIFSIESDITEIKNFQVNNSGQMWFERTKEQAEHVREWSENQKKNIDFFYNALIWISAIAALILSVLGFLFHRQQEQAALKNQNELEAKINEIATELNSQAEDAIENIKIKLETQQNDFSSMAMEVQNLIQTKEEEISELVKRCKEHETACAAHKEKAKNDSKAIEETRKIAVDKFERSEEEAKALEEVAKDEDASTYDRLRAAALQYQDTEEWEDALSTWKTLAKMFPLKAEPFFAQGYIFQVHLTSNDIFQDTEYKSQAESNYRMAITIDPKHTYALYNLGILLEDKAQNEYGIQRQDLFEQAEKNYREATDIDPNFSRAWNNWGWFLYRKAKLENEKQQTDILDQAEKKYMKATDSDHDNFLAWNNWGVLLKHKARNKQGQTKRYILKQAETKYITALKIQPENPKALYNWSCSLIDRAKISTPPNNSLLNLAKIKSLAAEKIIKGYGAYNLACIASLQKQFETCKKWIIKPEALAPFISPCEHLKSDTDLDNIRNHPDYKDWFEDFVNQVCQEEQEAKTKQAESDGKDTDTEA
ncbi:hypothetical protein D0S45_06515 [Marinifilum sp. JC120]|nr:hypothetical protein D0S45_06515 [Marinifilum sp. JC120]